MQWLQRFARRQNPEFQMMVADYLFRRDIIGSQRMMRDLVRRALHDPAAFPDGLFRVADYQILGHRYDPDDPAWPPTDAIVNGAAASRNPLLVSDLLDLLKNDRHILPTERSKLLPLLSHPDIAVRRAALDLFDVWHGKPPKDTDALVWHRSRAKLGMKELKAAKAAPGG